MICKTDLPSRHANTCERSAFFVQATIRKIYKVANKFLPGLKSGPVGNGMVYHVAMQPVKEKFFTSQVSATRFSETTGSACSRSTMRDTATARGPSIEQPLAHL